MDQIKAPERVPMFRRSVFLAGSIEMGVAENWQQRFVDEVNSVNWIALNPRREQWDSSWEQDIKNPLFNEQVTWELDHIHQANAVVFYFDPNTMSPISLMELGLVAASDQNVIVCCPPGFWRKGNVDILCRRHNIQVVNTLSELIDEVQTKIAINGRWSR